MTATREGGVKLRESFQTPAAAKSRAVRDSAGRTLLPKGSSPSAGTCPRGSPDAGAMPALTAPGRSTLSISCSQRNSSNSGSPHTQPLFAPLSACQPHTSLLVSYSNLLPGTITLLSGHSSLARPAGTGLERLIQSSQCSVPSSLTIHSAWGPAARLFCTAAPKL